MNLVELHTEKKAVSAINLFKGDIGTATAIQLEQNEILKEHITKTPALLICISGIVKYEDENGKIIEIQNGDYISIIPFVKHWLIATSKAQLVLLK